MEKKGVLIPLIIALGAAVIYWMVLTSKESALRKSYEIAHVIVARTDLPARQIMREDLVEVADVPRKYMQVDAFEVSSPSVLKQINNLVTTVRIPKGNQITQSSLVSMSPEAGLSVKVHPGKRGAIMSVDNEILRLIKPNDKIDVLVTFEAVMSDGRKEKVTVTLLQNITVIGVGSDLGQGMDSQLAKQKQAKESEATAFSEKGVLSLELSSDESQFLALAKSMGEISVAVRGMGDTEIHLMPMASFRRLFKQ